MDSKIQIPEVISNKKLIFVIDNEPRNKAVVSTMQNLIEQKFDIVVWPKSIKEKDINDMVLSGKTTEQLIDIIKQNTYNGLQAQLKLNEWKKI